MKEQVMYMIVSQNAILIKQKITQFYDTVKMYLYEYVK